MVKFQLQIALKDFTFSEQTMLTMCPVDKLCTILAAIIRIFLNLFSGRAANHGNVEALIMLAVAHLYSEGGKMHVICYDNP